MLRNYIVLFLLFCGYLLHAQNPPAILWDKKIGTFANDEAHVILQNLEGNLVVAGKTNTPYLRGKDIFFAVFDTDGQVLFEKQIGTNNDEEVFGLLQNVDGSYFMAAYMEQKGEQQAWLIHLDEKGETLSDTILGKGSLHDLLADEEGNIYVTGQINEQLLLAKFNKNGQEEWRISELEGGLGQAIYKGKDQTVIITGYKTNSKKEELILVKYNLLSQKELWRTSFENAKGMDLIVEEDGSIVVTGMDYSVSERENMLFLKVDKSGSTIFRNSFGGKRLDGGLSLIKSYNGSYFIAGYNQSYKRGASRKKGWIQYLNANGEEIWDTPFWLGGAQDDIANDLIQLHDGSIVFTGRTASNGSKLDDIWLAKFQEESLPAPESEIDFLILSKEFKEETSNQFLEPSERCYYEIELKNQSNVDACQVVVDIAVNNPPEGFFYFEKIEVGRIKRGAIEKIRIPIRGDKNILDGEVVLEIKVSSSGILFQQFSSLPIKTRALLEPELVLSMPEFISRDKDYFQKGEPITLNFQLSNKGGFSAKQVLLQFSLPAQVHPLKALEQNIKTLAPGESRNFSFDFIAEHGYLSDSITIGCRVKEQKNKFGENARFMLELSEKEINNFVDDQKKISEDPTSAFLKMNWIQPQFNEGENKNIIVEKESVILEVQAISSALLEKKDIAMELQQELELQEGIKFDEKYPLICKTSQENKTGNYIANCRCRVFLQTGENKIKFKAKNEVGESETTEISFQLKPNLYLLSIGIPHDDLKYTQKDAADFAEAYKSQEGRLFQRVDIRLFNTVENTQTQFLRERILDLANEFEVGIIRPIDQVIIFISSHGKNYEDEDKKSFRLHASDFKELYASLYSLDFQTDILETLKNVKCKKTMFVDACNSGAVEEVFSGTKFGETDIVDFSETLVNIIDEEAAALRAIVSCSSTQLSYEDDIWQNGAFTKGLLEALQNKEVVTGEYKIVADKNKDNLLSIGETYEFLTQRVAYMVKAVKGKTQSPYLSEKHRNEKTSVFQLK